MASHRSLLAWALLSALLLVPACSTCRRTPAPGDEVYREAVTAFHTGLAAMQTTQEVLARQKLDQVTTLVPDEPAGWANLGLLLLRQQELDAGAKALARAASLAPDSPEIARLQALASSRQGNLPEAIGHWRRTLELDPNDLEAGYALALETERQGGESNERDAQRLLAQLLGRQDNLAARIEYVRLAAKRGDGAALTSAVGPLAAAARTWSPDARAQLDSVLDAAADNPRAAATRVAFLKNYLLREPVYRAALADVSTPREEVGRPLTHFARLKNPDPQPAPADTSLAFSLDVPPGAAPGASWVGAVHLTGEGGAVVASAGPTGVSVSDAIPGALAGGVLAPESGLATPDAVAAADLNYDFRTDLAIAGPGGVRLLRQGVTATSPTSPPRRPCRPRCGPRQLTGSGTPTPTPMGTSIWSSRCATVLPSCCATTGMAPLPSASRLPACPALVGSYGPTSTVKAFRMPPSSTTRGVCTSSRISGAACFRR